MYQSRIRGAKQRQQKDRVLLNPSEGQDYALVQDMCGNGRVRCLCPDGEVRMGRIRGSMRKYHNKAIVTKDDLVLIAYRDFDEDKVDIVHKFTHTEQSRLLRNKELPQAIAKAITCADGVDDEDGYIEFDEDDGVDIDISGI